MRTKLGSVLLGATLSLVLAGLSIAAEQAPPMVLPHGQHDVRTATPGIYMLDVQHTAMIARVSHLGFSMSAFRFGKSHATLQWDPGAYGEVEALPPASRPVRSRRRFRDSPTSSTARIISNVAKFPLATFVSTAFRPESVTRGKVDGKLTLLGKTVPATFDVTLVGAGPGFAAGPIMGHVIGIHAVTTVDPKAIGLPAVFSDPIEIAVDTEFTKKG